MVLRARSGAKGKPVISSTVDTETSLQIIEDNLDMKAMVEKVLDETGHGENRGAKMAVNDLLMCVPRQCAFT